MTGELYDYATVSNLIERYCQDHGIKEADYAALIDVHPGSLSRIKAGKMCSPEILAKVAALSHIPVGQLIHDAPDGIREQLFAAGKAKNIPVCI